MKIASAKCKGETGSIPFPICCPEVPAPSSLLPSRQLHVSGMSVLWGACRSDTPRWFHFISSFGWILLGVIDDSVWAGEPTSLKQCPPTTIAVVFHPHFASEVCVQSKQQKYKNTPEGVVMSSFFFSYPIIGAFVFSTPLHLTTGESGMGMEPGSLTFMSLSSTGVLWVISKR